jgi:hypothetical protein
MGIVATLGLVYAGFTALAVAAAVSIVRKAGYSGWWVLGGLVPLANVVLVFAFAFADWPMLRELRQLRQGQAAVHWTQRPNPSTGHPAFTHPSGAAVRRP